jgi:RHS repeat-associated protein
MPPNRETLLCRYHYDPLDRLVDCTPSAQAPTRRFYLKDRLTTEIQDAVQRSIMQHDDQLLAQQQRQNGAVEARLLATDQQRSVLNVLDVARPHPVAYSPYGHRLTESGLLSLLGFNGERADPVTGYYLLGNGYRAFNPVLMRFNSPDSWSPFGKGGLNAYAYCEGNPVSQVDPSGHYIIVKLFKGIANKIGARTPSSAKTLIGTGSPQKSTIEIKAPKELPPSYAPRDQSVEAFRRLRDAIDAGERIPEGVVTPQFIQWRHNVEITLRPETKIGLPSYNDAITPKNSNPPEYNTLIRLNLTK